MATLLRGYAKQYVTADLYERVDQKLNIEVIDLPDEPFDVIVCSHVLHYVNDRKALPELKRILRNRGQMILWCPLSKAFQRTRTTSSQVPRIETTTSDTGTTSAFYCSDFRDRLRDAGLFFTEYVAAGIESGRRKLAALGSLRPC
jgi:ubiquinone/menaquinone biosynthesis C-methylase UbiE